MTNSHISISEQQQPQYYDVVVFCHLRWHFVWQRPQHIISRISVELKVLLIEEPLLAGKQEKQTAHLVVIHKNLHILQTKIKNIFELAQVLPYYILSKKVLLGWFYSPAFCPLLDYFNFNLVIYDCMDELSLFKGASPQLLAWEKILLRKCNLVFTGGKSLYEAKSLLHSKVYCFPSAVDEPHFAKALSLDLTIPEDISSCPKPIVGYIGVIDERVDLGLLNNIAIRNPGVSFIMIGPLAKIDPEELPRQKNIYYLGMKSYETLPYYLKAFDVAMMPFALNESTKYISPTKTLEYMAAGKPIISTAIKDVVRDYHSCVHIVASTEDFSRALEKILLNPSDDSYRVDFRNILANTSWDRTVQQMKGLIDAEK